MRFFSRNNAGDELRRYLLGSLPESQQERIEQRLLTDSDFFDELLASEDELVDQYFSKRLSERERSQFEAHFSLSKDHRQKIQFGQVLRTYLESRFQPRVERSVGNPLFGNFQRQHSVLVFALVLIVCFGALGLAWLIFKRQVQTTPVSPAAVVTLVPGSVRSEGALQRVKQAPQNSAVQFKLELGTSEYAQYKVVLSREDQLLTSFEHLNAQSEAGHFILTVTVDSGILKPGDYQVRVDGISGNGQNEFKGQYRFRVIP
jgi:hypothetical protein